MNNGIRFLIEGINWEKLPDFRRNEVQEEELHSFLCHIVISQRGRRLRIGRTLIRENIRPMPHQHKSLKITSFFVSCPNNIIRKLTHRSDNENESESTRPSPEVAILQMASSTHLGPSSELSFFAFFCLHEKNSDR